MADFDTEEKRRRALNASLRAANLTLLPFPYNNGEHAEDRAHVAGFYKSALIQKEHAVYYAVELSLNGETLTDQEINLDNGTFRWITGTPIFFGIGDGAIMEPNGQPNTHRWYEGILVKDGMSNPSRKIDIKNSGDYATLNGFSFSIRNDDFFWQKLINKKLYIADSVVTVYAVLDKKFHSIWQGVVRSTAYTETEFVFKCETNFKVIHKDFPPLVVTDTLIPNVNEKAVGKVIPVCFGDVPYASGLNVSETVRAVSFPGTNGRELSVFAANAYSNDSQRLLTLRTPVVSIITQNELKGRYLRIVYGEGDAYYLIESNEASSGTGENRVTPVTLGKELKDFDLATSIYPPGTGDISDPVYEKIWFFQIVNVPVKYAISQRPILETGSDVCNYDNGYRSVKEFALLDQFYGQGSSVGNELNFAGFSTITEKDAGGKIDDENGVGFLQVLNSNNPNDRMLIGRYINENPKSCDGSNVVNIELRLPLMNGDDSIANFERVYLAVDMDCICFANNWKFDIKVHVKDNYDRYLGTDLLEKEIDDVKRSFSITGQEPVSNNRLNFISNEHYRSYFGTFFSILNDNTSIWDSPQSLNPRDLTALNVGMVQDIFTEKEPDGPENSSTQPPKVYSEKIRLKIIIQPKNDGDVISGVKLRLKEICFGTLASNSNWNWGRQGSLSEREDIKIFNAGGSSQLWTLSNWSRSGLVYNEKNISKEGSSPFIKEFDISLSENRIKNRLQNATEINLCIDSDIECYSKDNVEWFFKWEAYRIKRVDGQPETGENNNLFQNGIIGPFPVQNCTYNFLPDIYYSPVENPPPRNSLWPVTRDSRFRNGFDTKNMALLNPKIIEMIKTGALSDVVRVRITIGRESGSLNNTDVALFRLKNIGLIGVNEQEFKEDDVYAIDCKGEYSGVKTDPNKVKTDTVYGVFYNLLKEYDGIVNGSNNLDHERIDIDKLNYLKETRGSPTWRTGRQILEKKKTFDYLKELCRQSFVGIVPSRSGRLILSAWLDQGDGNNGNIPSFDEDTIIRNSIKGFTRTEPKDLYNEFQINYKYNPGANKFDKCIIVTNTDKAEFPEYADDRNTWAAFVGGIPLRADAVDIEASRMYNYSISKHLWTLCREGYKFAGKSQEAPSSLTNLHWCVDDSHALAYLENLIYWTTRPKAQVEFSVPINARIKTSIEAQSTRRNVELELLEKVFFKDKIYTDEKILTGYITKIEPIVKKGEIKIEVIFEPDDYSDLIVETGNSPIIEESGSRENIITEGRNLL